MEKCIGFFFGWVGSCREMAGWLPERKCIQVLPHACTVSFLPVMLAWSDVESAYGWELAFAETSCTSLTIFSTIPSCLCAWGGTDSLELARLLERRMMCALTRGRW